MDWDDYQYFLAVAGSGSVSAAARRLGQSHSTVLRRLDKLETALDVRLFERFQTGYVLTTHGEALRELLAPIDEGMRSTGPSARWLTAAIRRALSRRRVSHWRGAGVLLSMLSPLYGR